MSVGSWGQSSAFSCGIPVPSFDDLIDESELTRSMPSFQSFSDSSCQRISPTMLANFLKNPSLHSYDSIHILDARFDYEFRGGHIMGAITITSEEAMIDFYNQHKSENTLIVIHCEFSKDRGPHLYDLFRSYDRKQNKYPNLTYPNLFVLDGGFKKFYFEHSDLCVGRYVPMRHSHHVNNGDLKKQFSSYKQKMSLSRFDNRMLIKRTMSIDSSQFVLRSSGVFEEIGFSSNKSFTQP